MSSNDQVPPRPSRAELAFASPRKLPKPKELRGRVVVLDVAFASEASSGGFSKITLPFLEGLGPRLAGWVDHHDHVRHADYAGDPRFVLTTKAEHGACPEIVTPELVKRIGPVDTIVCHTDFDGLASAAKWMRGGVEPYPGCDEDARAIDTRIGTPSSVAQRFDRAIRGRPRDTALFGVIVRHLANGLEDASLWEPIDRAAESFAKSEHEARRIAASYQLVELGGERVGVPRGCDRLAFVDATKSHGLYDKTLLLLLGQERAPIAMLRDMDTLSLAASFDSGIDFLAVLGLSGGMPTLVSVQHSRMEEALTRLGASRADILRLTS
ncbi:MAG: hypothetical protein U0169_10440 [Polyangiaceae bacterium]